MVEIERNFKLLESKIRYVVDILQRERQYPRELQETTTRLLINAKKLSEYLSGHDFSGFQKVLSEMRHDAWKARAFAALRPDLSTETQRNLDFVRCSIEALDSESGLN